MTQVCYKKMKKKGTKHALKDNGSPCTCFAEEHYHSVVYYSQRHFVCLRSRKWTLMSTAALLTLWYEENLP